MIKLSIVASAVIVNYNNKIAAMRKANQGKSKVLPTTVRGL